jgi:hypothetical protein
MGFAIIVDGPNFINDIHRYGKDVDFLLNNLSFPAIDGRIQQKLKENGLSSHPFIHTYFVVSDRGNLGHLKNEDKIKFLNILRNQREVTVDEIIQSHGKGKEQQVDMSVFIRMLEMGPLSIPHYDPWRHIVLISSDSDYVPAIRLLSRMGTHTIVAGFRKLGEKEYPIELINEAYLFIEMSEIVDALATKKQ